MNIYEVILDRMNRHHYIIVIISIVYVYITFNIDSFLLDNLLNSMIDYQFSRVGIVNRGEFLYRYEFFDIYIIISSFFVVLTSYVAYRYISNICATSYMFYMASTVLCIFAILLMNSIYLYSDYRSSLVSNQVIDCIHSKKCAFNTEKYLFLSQLRGFADNYVAGGNVNVITYDLKKYDDIEKIHVANFYCLLGMFAERSGDYKRARSFYSESLAIDGYKNISATKGVYGI